MPSSALTTISAIPENSAATPGLWNSRLSDINANFASLPAYPPLNGEWGVTNTAFEWGDLRRYGGVPDGVTDNASAFQSMISSALSLSRGLMMVKPQDGTNSYVVGSTITLNPTAVTSGDFVFMLHGSRISYTGSSYLFDFDATATSDTASRIKVMGGRLGGTSGASGCFRITDCGAGVYDGQNIIGFTNGIAYHFRNDDNFSENNSVLNAQVGGGFKHIAKFEVVGGGPTSFARTVFNNIKGSGGSSGQPWFYVQGAVYDSNFDVIKGNVTDGVSSIFAFYGTHGGTTVRGVKVESAGTYYGFHIDPTCTNAPIIEDYDLRGAAASFTTTTDKTNVQRKRLVSGLFGMSFPTRSLTGPSTYSIDPDQQNWGFDCSTSAGDVLVVLPSISSVFEGTTYFVKRGVGSQSNAVIVMANGTDTINGSSSSMKMYGLGSGIWLHWKGSGTAWTVVGSVGLSEAQIGTWYMDNAAANVSDQTMQFTHGAGTSDNSTAWTVQRPGWITALALHSNASRVAGALSADVYINATKSTAFGSATLNASDLTYVYKLQLPGTVNVNTGDAVQVKFTSTSAWTPTTADIRASIGIMSS